MADAIRNYGVTDLETVASTEPMASVVWPPRTIDIVVASGQGTCPKGQLLSLDTGTGKYVKWNGTLDIAGYLNEAIDATSGDVKTELLFDTEVLLSELTGGSTISVGFQHVPQLNIKEAL